MASGHPGVLPLGMLIIFGDELTSDSTGQGGSVSRSFVLHFARDIF